MRPALFLGAAIALALAYALTPEGWPVVPLALLKASAVAVLAVYALNLRTTDSALFAAGLGASAVGDVLLNLAPLTYGLGAFLTAHLIYLAVFVRAIRRDGRRGGPAMWATLAALYVLVAVMLGLLWGDLGAMRAPVLAYMAAITAMATAAVLAPSRGLALPLGAALFVLSDSLIALQTFLPAPPLPPLAFDPGIWITYIAAQVLLTLGFAGMVSRNP